MEIALNKGTGSKGSMIHTQDNRTSSMKLQRVRRGNALYSTSKGTNDPGSNIQKQRNKVKTGSVDGGTNKSKHFYHSSTEKGLKSTTKSNTFAPATRNMESSNIFEGKTSVARYSRNAKTYSTVVKRSNTIRLLRSQNSKGKAIQGKANSRKNQQEHYDNRDMSQTFTRTSNLNDRTQSESSNEENCRKKPSIEDSRVMPSLIKNDTETDSVSMFQSMNEETSRQLPRTPNEKGKDENLQDDDLLKNRLYEGIYCLGDKANDILSLAFYNKKHAIPELVVSESKEVTRSEF